MLPSPIPATLPPVLSDLATLLEGHGAELDALLRNNHSLAGTVATGLLLLIAQWFQHRRLATQHRHDLEVVERRGQDQLTKSLEVAREQARLDHEREEIARDRQCAESERAERLQIHSAIALLLPRLADLTGIHFLAARPRNPGDEEDARRFRSLGSFIKDTPPHGAHPERNLDLRVAFLIFQLCAAGRLALDARWSRALTERQQAFLAEWDLRIEPVLCSGAYPGEPFLWREQLEIVVNLMITKSTRIVLRPLDWREFVLERDRGPELAEIADAVARPIRRIFDESEALPRRRASQCRLAILGLYLLRLQDESGRGSRSGPRYEETFWGTVVDWFRWQEDAGQNPSWFVFEPGDVRERAARAPRERKDATMTILSA